MVSKGSSDCQLTFNSIEKYIAPVSSNINYYFELLQLIFTSLLLSHLRLKPYGHN